MSDKSADGILQAAAVISKTTPVTIGAILPCRGYTKITLYFTYVKGDETGLTITPKFMQSASGTAHPFCEWSSAAGAKTVTASTFTLTASINGYITLDIGGHDFVMFTQNGTANDGTPTGTLAASYLLKTD